MARANAILRQVAVQNFEQPNIIIDNQNVNRHERGGQPYHRLPRSVRRLPAAAILGCVESVGRVRPCILAVHGMFSAWGAKFRERSAARVQTSAM